jgi:hypothetical protein
LLNLAEGEGREGRSISRNKCEGPNLERNIAKEARKERYGGDEPESNARESVRGRQESNETKGESIIRR